MSININNFDSKKQTEINLIYTAYSMVCILNSLVQSDFVNSKTFNSLPLGSNANAIKDIIKQVSIGNQVTFLICLYCYLVLPKELLNDLNTEIEICNKKIGQLEIVEELSTYPKDQLEEGIDYMYHLRNSVSHANYRFEDDCFIFEDSNPNKPEHNFVFKISKMEAGKILHILEVELILKFIENIQT